MKTRHSQSRSFQREKTSIDDWLHQQISQPFMGLSPISLSLALGDWWSHLSISPGRQLELAQLAWQLGQEVWTPLWRPSTGEPIADARFAAAPWQQWPYHMFSHGFKAMESWWQASAHVAGMDKHHEHMVQFFARQWLDSLSPSNWPLTNPEIAQSWYTTQGQSLSKGFQNYWKDMQRLPHAHQQLPELPYRVGVDVAKTPGQVVFQNELIELIQYAPTTKQVQKEPLLIVPSCIMKYYILDLSEHNSMVKYLVDQGLTVFMVSWRNPTAQDRELSMDDYVKLGVLDAVAQVQELSQSEQIHAMGYCLGGTFLAIAAAYLARQGQTSPLRSVSLLAAQTDFSEPGELGVYIDDDQLLTLREEMAEKGYLSGRQMAASFQFLNSRDLIWSRNTQRYWLGQDEVGNDMMSWNMDTTRLPERMHNEYLDQLFLNDALTQGHFKTQGCVIALMDIRSPMFVVGTTRDHISPWRSVYKIHLTTDAPITFVLASGGHNAGIVSEPGHPHRSYQMLTQQTRHAWMAPDVWLAQAADVQGSWWQAWAQWLQEQSSASQVARALPHDPQAVAAPGNYVRTRWAD